MVQWLSASKENLFGWSVAKKYLQKAAKSIYLLYVSLLFTFKECHFLSYILKYVDVQLVLFQIYCVQINKTCKNTWQ